MPVSREIIEPKNERLNVSRSMNLPHSPGIRAGDFIFLSGMLSTDPQTGERSPGTMAHETRQTLTNMRHLLESAGVRIDRQPRCDVILECDLLSLSFRRQRGTNILDQTVQLNRRGSELHVPTLDRG